MEPVDEVEAREIARELHAFIDGYRWLKSVAKPGRLWDPGGAEMTRYSTDNCEIETDGGLLSLPPEIAKSVPHAELPALYEAAKTALANRDRVDEIDDWADMAAALVFYARMADDHELEHSATRIRTRAVRRLSQLLRQLDGRGCAKSGTPPIFSARREAAENARQNRPALAPLTLTASTERLPDWVICGGESGRGARVMKLPVALSRFGTSPVSSSRNRIAVAPIGGKHRANVLRSLRQKLPVEFGHLADQVEHVGARHREPGRVHRPIPPDLKVWQFSARPDLAPHGVPA